MNLTYYPFKPFKINPGEITIISTESHKTYFDFLNGLLNRNDTVKFFDEESNLLEIKMNTVWIGDIFLNNQIDKLFQKELEAKILTLVNDETRQKIYEADYHIYQQLLETSYLMEMPILANYEFNLAKLLKNYQFRLGFSNLTNPFDMVELVINTAYELSIDKVLVICNLTDYLSVDEFGNVINLVKERGVKLLLIEFSESNKHESFKSGCYYFIDQDFVDWRYDND